MAGKITRDIGYFVLAALLIYPFLMYVGPRFESSIAPKMKYPAQLTRIEPDGQYRSLVWGETERISRWWRTCDFRGLEWYYGRRNARASSVTIEFLESPKNRPDGHMSFGAWRVHVPAEQLRTDTYSDAVHQCWWFGVIPSPWLLRSPFH